MCLTYFLDKIAFWIQDVRSSNVMNVFDPFSVSKFLSYLLIECVPALLFWIPVPEMLCLSEYYYFRNLCINSSVPGFLRIVSQKPFSFKPQSLSKQFRTFISPLASPLIQDCVLGSRTGFLVGALWRYLQVGLLCQSWVSLYCLFQYDL